jgi:hypothetical protein
MITNFETQTEPLTPEELQLVPMFIEGLKTKIGKDNSITGGEIQKAFAEKMNLKVGGARIRKIINHIRINGLVKYLCATSKGYYVANKKAEIEEYLTSLHERISAQTKVYTVLKEQMSEKNWE